MSNEDPPFNTPKKTGIPAIHPELAGVALEMCTDAVAIFQASNSSDIWTNAAFVRLSEAAELTPEGLLELLRGQQQATTGDDQVVRIGRALLRAKWRFAEPHSLVVVSRSGWEGNAQRSRDLVTDLIDRRSFEQLFRQRLESEKPFALFFLDLDGFKQVNDTLGHQAGDQVLCEVAQRVRDALRDEDMVARYGGDEFVVLADGVDCMEATVPIVARLELAIAEPIAAAQGSKVSFSIGVALSIDHAGDPEEMIRVADTRMYAAKRAEDQQRQL